MFRIAGLLKVTVGPKIDKASTLVKEFCLGLSRLMKQGIAIPSNHFTLLWVYILPDVQHVLLL